MCSVDLWMTPAAAYLPRWARQVSSSAEQVRATQYARSEDARRFLLSRALLRMALATTLERSASELTLDETNDGRLRAHSVGHWNFSLSRSAAAVSCVISKGARCGVDVESDPSPFTAADLLPFMLHSDEQCRLTSDPRLAELLEIWTRKEALAKAIGSGLPDDVRTLVVPLIAATHASDLWLRIDERWIVTTLRLESFQNTCVSVVVEHPGDHDAPALTLQLLESGLACVERVRLKIG